MNKKILKYTSIILGVFVLLIIYLSIVGIETEKFNNQIQDLVKQKNNKFDTSLKKIKLTLDPLSFRINAQTIDAKITFIGKPVELEYIKTQISLNSFIKSQLVTSEVEISTKPILLKNFVAFIRSINNRPELFFLERFIKKGYFIADLKFSFDEFGKLKEDYKINGLLKEGEISVFKKNKIEKINFIFNIEKNNFNFKDISFDTNNINFLSDRLDIKKNKKDYLLEGSLRNKKSLLNDQILQVIKLKYPQFDLINTEFESKNDFSFDIYDRFKVKNLAINSSILINSSQLKRNNLIDKNFIEINEFIDLKDHEIKASYSNKKLSIEGKGHVKLQNKFELINYKVINKGSNLNLVSNIELSEIDLKNQNLIKKYFPNTKNILNLKDHNININYKNNILFLKGLGKIKLQDKFDFIDYEVVNKGSNLNLVSNIELSEIDLKNQNLIKKYFPNTKNILNLKDHNININYKNNILSFKGLGKVKLENEFNKIGYSFSKKNKKYNFETDLEVNDAPLQIDIINYEKNREFNSQLRIIGDYTKKIGLNLKKISLISKNNKLLINNLILDNKNKIVKVDKIDLDYFDNSEKRNEFVLNRIKDNYYELNGSLLNANPIITSLLESKDDQQLNIFRENINISLNLSKVYLDSDNDVKNLKGQFEIIDNKIDQANVSAKFDDNKNLTFVINTKDDEKITTLFSSKAEPLVKRYKFIKGFEDSNEGYLDFYSSKKASISNSKLIIDNFKVKEIPALAKILSLASLQGIADLVTGEGIRFTDFEMNFTNKGKLMTINELYAIGPAISILIEGYIEENNLISLRGTLVPATTINRSIASIPFIGDLLIGKKVGEGVFGVSFKVKGPPKKLETTVNPIKTLTPRFITRTLEKIKKN
ncbi:AsmA-like C-terminal region-containing protein [Candidatus Pelagibacter sp.]|nr:AsmA-like C-terminal region-containing protein [Candidatus Pelagibacter sp.]